MKWTLAFGIVMDRELSHLMTVQEMSCTTELLAEIYN